MDSNMNIAIIVIGYNNSKALARLLDSLNKAEYENDTIPLIISLDKGDDIKVEEIARNFKWRNGEKEVRTFSKRQGLKRHILSCGEYLRKYDAIFVFEDDTLVAESFYTYGKQCIEYYKDDDRIAGISLYSFAWNQSANFPFEPVKNQYDTFFIQYAPSWGQIWLKKSWFEFSEWYERNKNFFCTKVDNRIPAILYKWGENSWLRYHIAYCILEDKYFVYPYCSHTTDFVQKGTHFSKDITRFQVNLIQGKGCRLQLAPLNSDAVIYDAFFESGQIKQFYQNKGINLTVDLYGCQGINLKKGMLLTTKNLPFRIVEQYALQLRPIELNVLMNIWGTEIFLYDMSKPAKLPDNKINFYIKRWDYFMKDRFLMFSEIIPICLDKMQGLIRSIIWRIRNYGK